TYAGAVLVDQTSPGRVFLAAGADGKTIYMTGIERGPSAKGERPNKPAVYKTVLPARGQAKVFFGHPRRAGDGDKRLNNPRGLAADGKGNLLIADHGNDRIAVVREADGKFLGAYAVPSPDWVDVHPASGAIYVHTAGSVVKFARPDKPGGELRELARLKLPKLPQREAARARWYFALDRQADPPVLWVGLSRGGTALMRCREVGGKFGPLTQAGYYAPKNFFNIATSLDRNRVLCKHGYNVVEVLDERTGKIGRLRLTGSPGQTYRFGPNGQLYGMDHAWPNGIRRWDAKGKSLPFAATAADPTLRGRLPNRPSGTTSWERDFDVDRAGNVYVKIRGKRYHGRMRVDKYDRDGNFIQTLIWVVSDGALGPRVGPRGNVYIAECVKPPGKSYPDFFKGNLPKTKIDKRGDVAQQFNDGNTTGTSREDSTLAWSNDNTHLVGLCAPGLLSQR
ncbi:hypothetical protein LCGC14_2652910, partial [marine sediment metagenome]